MNSNNSLTVWHNDALVGTLAMAPDAPVCTFQYSSEWLKDGFSISPIELPLKEGLFMAKEEPFQGNFGIFEDSLPDGYGRYLLHKILKRKGLSWLTLNPIQRLSIVGNSGMGVLRYEPETILETEPIMTDLDELQQKALDTLSEKTEGDEALLYYNSGNSGGCRPKALFKDSDGHWLVKFRHVYDPVDIGEMEYRYADAARRCGIDAPDFKLINGRYFASKRFDISEDGTRLHIATAAALLRQSISPPMLDYSNLLSLTGYLTQSRSQVEEMIRRMAFNVFAENKDDHGKNFSFICENGKWRLAPAYDLTRVSEGYNGEHATSVNFNGRPTIDDMVAVAAKLRIPKARTLELIQPIQEICSVLTLI